MSESSAQPRNWADVYTLRARHYDDPLDICELYSGAGRYSEELLGEMCESIAQSLQLQADDRVLEVGCGCAVLMRRLMDRVGDFVGVDMSPGVLDVARAVLPSARFHCSSADALPFADDSFDKCLCYHAIHYFGDYDTAARAIREMGRVARPGAKMLIGQVPNANMETEYQQQRRTRAVRRQERVTHNLRWLWYPPSFFDRFCEEFSRVEIRVVERLADAAAPFRFDVEIIV